MQFNTLLSVLNHISGMGSLFARPGLNYYGLCIMLCGIITITNTNSISSSSSSSTII